ncbi:YceD family protein [Actinokineospora bangkokensis]|uniref:Metal-binding protein n=1 Tax=Actinokineospora bangkokensis TaxID=1193682 RepID=A0A1Q9LHQ4_9PSEU|nr:YceD family protein [Actinokineospora bangkokensis]OLR91571.1 metal-binding protein [Actinokineospora bangkokensis]
MSPARKTPDNRPALSSPWVVDTRELGRRPGSSRPVRRTAEAAHAIGLEGVIAIPPGDPVELDLLLESVVEGVLVTGTASGTLVGECSRCLDPITEPVVVDITELYAYPDSTTDETTDDDEVSRLVDDRVDLEPVVRDAVVLAVPNVPLCGPDCAGLCPDCGRKWAEVGPDHRHETIDPRWAALQERFQQGSGQ